MEVFRSPASSALVVNDVYMVTANTTRTADLTATTIYVYPGVTWTVDAGVTVNCCTLTSDGTTIVNGTLLTSCEETAYVTFGAVSEIFKAPAPQDVLLAVSTSTVKQESFRVPRTQDVLVAYE